MFSFFQFAGHTPLDSLLNYLVGRWSLTGKWIGGRLYQDVDARWVLRDTLLEITCSCVKVGVEGNPDYDALYLMGYDKKEDKYVLHLFDTYGVSAKPVPGIGLREENSIKFKFDYSVGPWLNVFTWRPEQKSWLNKITYEKDGQTAVFAEKELVAA